jgi:DNA repair exonuclease SbcCD ATPase subunit
MPDSSSLAKLLANSKKVVSNLASKLQKLVAMPRAVLSELAKVPELNKLQRDLDASRAALAAKQQQIAQAMRDMDAGLKRKKEAQAARDPKAIESADRDLTAIGRWIGTLQSDYTKLEAKAQGIEAQANKILDATNQQPSRAKEGKKVGIWKTGGADPCKVCRRLNGTNESVWRKEAPKGPPMHPNCRCSIKWTTQK